MRANNYEKIIAAGLVPATPPVMWATITFAAAN